MRNNHLAQPRVCGDRLCDHGRSEEVCRPRGVTAVGRRILGRPHHAGVIEQQPQAVGASVEKRARLAREPLHRPEVQAVKRREPGLPTPPSDALHHPLPTLSVPAAEEERDGGVLREGSRQLLPNAARGAGDDDASLARRRGGGDEFREAAAGRPRAVHALHCHVEDSACDPGAKRARGHRTEAAQRAADAVTLVGGGHRGRTVAVRLDLGWVVVGWACRPIYLSSGQLGGKPCPAPRTPGKAQVWPRASEGTKRSPV